MKTEKIRYPWSNKIYTREVIKLKRCPFCGTKPTVDYDSNCFNGENVTISCVYFI